MAKLWNATEAEPRGEHWLASGPASTWLGLVRSPLDFIFALLLALLLASISFLFSIASSPQNNQVLSDVHF